MSNQFKIRHFFSMVSLVSMTFVLSACNAKDDIVVNTDATVKEKNSLYADFKNPPAEARPFVRWWWNDNEVKKKELDRELEVLKKVGFGGVEINPIAAQRSTKPDNSKGLVWMSDEWIDMMVHASKKSKDLGMITDMIVGTGWPFGGEFLQHHETSQRVIGVTLPFDGKETIELSQNDLIEKMLERNKHNHRHLSKNITYELFYAYLVPQNSKDKSQAINLKAHVNAQGDLKYKIKTAGNYQLRYGIKEQSFRRVTAGAKGGKGDVMDHYKKDVTYQYLSRLNKISEKTGIPLSELVRALFCDSIEISGANWTDGFFELFSDTYGYSVDQWLPYIFYPPYKGYQSENYDDAFVSDFKDQVKRVRYDYNRLLVETFLSNFTQVFQDFCNEKNLLCKYQAYGTPFLMGMFDGYMIPDIPESNSWLYSSSNKSHDMKDPAWTYNYGKGYMIWNLIASSAGHLGDKKIISSETMTNTKGVFRTTMQEIKQHDDMNFITGINHSVLHGFNYSPPEVGFPGWLRYGAYFSEHNPWWEHLHHWVDYNARLSSVFQNSQAEKSIAIVGPTSDVWGDAGLSRGAYHKTPIYLFKLWESISQLGYSNDHINEKIIQGATIENGVLQYGKMKYRLLVLASLKSIEPETAMAIKAYVASGGQLIVIDQLPTKSVHFSDYKKNDEIVKTVMENMGENYSQSIITVARPASTNNLLPWTKALLERTSLKPDVQIDKPHDHVYQIYKSTDDEKIYFFNNSHRFDTASFNATFPNKGQFPYVWNPETGERKPYGYQTNANELSITLKPLESLLLVFEDEEHHLKYSQQQVTRKNIKVLNNTWKVTGKRIDGKVINWKMDKLVDFSQSSDESQKTFGGKIVYKTSFEAPKGVTHIDLGDVNQGVTQLFVNGKSAGTRWYGQAVYPIESLLRKGKNSIEIHYSTILTNYAVSLKDNPGAQQWASHGSIDPTGIEGDVTLLSYTQ